MGPTTKYPMGDGMKRRSLITSALAGAGLLTIPTREAKANTAASDRKFLFVRVPHGWDTTRVFTPMFSTTGVSMEEDAFTRTVEDINYVAHDNRPAVDTFFDTYGRHTALLNGLIVPSVNHAICDRLLYSDSSTGSSPDWATQIASAQSDRYTLPHVLVSGRVLAGNRANLIVNVGTEGQMNQLLTGELMSLADQQSTSPDVITQAILSKHLSQSAVNMNNAFGDFYEQSMERIRFMKDISSSGLVNWNTDGSLTSQIQLTKDLFRNDLTRCVTLEFKRESFDSHVDNDAKQSANFQDLFTFLNELMSTLQHTPASTSGTLLDEVCIVVLSEMGRTPYQNGGKGKDHWQHTSAMLMGSGIRGGQTCGEFSSLFYGQPIDLQSGDVTASGQDISTRLLGDTLLALGDVGNEFTPLGDPIWSLLD